MLKTIEINKTVFKQQKKPNKAVPDKQYEMQ